MRRLIAVLLLALAAPILAQDAAVSVRTLADGSRAMSHELIVPAKPAAIWRAVATAEGWQTWAVPLVRTVPGTDRFETNYDPSARLGSPSGIEQQWLVRKAPRTVSFRTTRTPAGFPHASAYLKVVSTFTLTPVGPNSTRVRLTGSGYPAGAEGDALIAFFRRGNSAALHQLHKRFASGPITWPAPVNQAKGEQDAGN